MGKKMKLKRSLRGKAILFGLLLITICLLQTTPLKSSSNSQLDVSSGLELGLQTEYNSYEKGEHIKISGNITNISDEMDIPDNIVITLQHEDWMRYIITALQNNSYEYFYNISFGDPEGIWNITVEIDGEPVNNISCKNVNVSLPSDTVRYKTVWFSPSDEAIYYRGSTFDISVFITEDDVGVTNASTICFLPSMESIELSEIKQGYYSGSYFVPWDAAIGLWSLSVESTTGNGSSLVAGGSNILIEIKPTSLTFDILGPPSDEYVLGEAIELMVHVRYPDGHDVEGAIVAAKIAGENYTLLSQGDGIYSINCTTVMTTVGSQIIEFSASDSSGNNLFVTHIIYLVDNEKSEFPLYQILGFLAVTIIVVIIIYFAKKRLSLLRVKDIENEIEELQLLQNEAAVNYYKKGTITRQTYDIFQKENSQRLAVIKKDGPTNKKVRTIRLRKKTKKA
ncbi:MAG: hypothetical protein NT038_09160 [Euryarchaeota archaeon]|nr:hypothetical protein [Euryarchaeota archaeon]